MIIHIPNEGKRSKVGGYLLKRQGLRKGVSDFFLPLASKGFHGLWIELKSTDQKRKATKEQLDWLERMIKMGYAAHIAYGWLHASRIVMDYLR